jgi:cytochrome c oxidase subunit 2
MYAFSSLSRSQKMKHFGVIAILVAASTLLVHAGLTSLGLFPPEASTQAVPIDQLFGLHIWLISFMFSVIIVPLAYSLIVFRRKAGDMEDGAHITGDNRLEVIWTAIPLMIVIYLAYVGAIALGQTREIDPSALQVKVTAGQWYWQFQYPEYGVASNELYLPVDRQIELQMSSNDVIHSFWVPEFRVKQDLVPGQTTELRITPTIIGNYTLRCSELCGLNHAYMTSPVHVVSAADFQTWITTEQQTASSDPVLRGQQLVQQYGCLGCHTTDGSKKIGPTWGHLFGSQVQLSDGTTIQADENYLMQSIEDPNSQVVAGFQPNVMPPFKDTLDQSQIQSIAAYIESLK